MKIRNVSIFVACGFVAMYGLILIGQDKSDSKKAPELFQAKFETTAGDFVIEVHREWAPIGADRFHKLVSSGFYDDCKFYRAMRDFMVQFGMSGDPKITKKWDGATIKDDPVMKSNKRGFVTFAKTGRPNSRTTQIFINTNKQNLNTRLDSMGFAPFGEVIEGMDAVDKINTEYDAEPAKFTEKIESDGNKFLETKFPRLDGVKKATIVEKK